MRAALARRALAVALGTALAASACGGAAPTIARDRPAKERLDFAVNRYYARDFRGCAATVFGVLKAIPEGDMARDSAQFYLASSLVELGYAEAGVRLFLDIVAGRRSPEFAARSLTELDALARAGLVEEGRLISVLFGQEFADLPADTEEFVAYHQALGEFRRGYHDWAARRLGELAGSGRYYGWRARYGLAVLRMAQKQDQGAETLLKEILRDRSAPLVVRNASRIALARVYYESKKYAEASKLYDTVDAPLPSLDVLLLEQSWAQLAGGDERRTLGMLVGLDAPVYRRLFAPERMMIRALALRNLCQYRLAHLAVTDFQRRYGSVLERIRDRGQLREDPVLREAAMRRMEFVPTQRRLERLGAERGRLDQVKDRELRDYLAGLYSLWVPGAERTVARELDRSVERLADELLAVNEQMEILEYELGIGLFRQVTGGPQIERGDRTARVPRSSDQVFYRFDGEYWSDELRDYAVWVFDRCPQ